MFSTIVFKIYLGEQDFQSYEKDLFLFIFIFFYKKIKQTKQDRNATFNHMKRF